MSEPDFEVIFASSDAERHAAQRLRYDVFVRELGGNGPLVDHVQRLEIDRFDPFSRHLLLLDRARGLTVSNQVVGVYRLLDQEGAERAGSFYSEHEFDLTPLISSRQRLLELGRSCLHADYRGGMAMFHLWAALATHVFEQDIDILFGTASFTGTDIASLDKPLTLLHERHLAPEHLRPVSRGPMPKITHAVADEADRKTAMMLMPALIKAYLRLGGCVGEGVFLDHDFNTTDVCLVLDVNSISDKQRKLYTQDRAR